MGRLILYLTDIVAFILSLPAQARIAEAAPITDGSSAQPANAFCTKKSLPSAPTQINYRGAIAPVRNSERGVMHFLSVAPSKLNKFWKAVSRNTAYFVRQADFAPNTTFGRDHGLKFLAGLV